MQHKLITSRTQCYYCKGVLTDENRTKDHIWPKSKGGKLSRDNKVYACRRCNKSKGNSTLEEWLEQLKVLEKTKKNKKVWENRLTVIGTLYSLIDQYKYK